MPRDPLEEWLGALARGDLRQPSSVIQIADVDGPRLYTALDRMRRCWIEERERTVLQTLQRITDEQAAIQRTSTIFNVHTDGIVIVNATWQVTRANDAFLDMVGWTRTEVTGTAFEKFVIDPAMLHSNVVRIIDETGVVRDAALVLRKRSGALLSVSVSGAAIGQARPMFETVLVARDVRETERRIAAEARADAERRRSEELRQALDSLDAAHRELATSREKLLHADRLAAIGQIAAGVAHEINNPAAFVLANLDLMSDRIAAVRSAVLSEATDAPLILRLLDDMAEMTAENSRGVSRVAAIAQDLKTFSRIEHAEVEMLDLNELARVAIRMVGNELRHRGRLVKNLADIPQVVGDRGKLAQVLLNLLINAVQSLDEKRRASNVVTVSSREANGRVLVAVQDTGCGMSDEVRERIFEPFFTTKQRDSGTGLGLSLSAEIVAAHRGRIDVESTPGGGSRFEISIPINAGQTAGPLHRRRRPRVEYRNSGRILLIDDERDLCRAVQRFLDPPHEVVYTVSGRDALELLKEDRAFDVILCDVMMPDLDGTDVYAATAKFAPELLDKFVFWTGGVFVERVQAFLDAHRNRCLSKPIPRQDLCRFIEEYVIQARRGSRDTV